MAEEPSVSSDISGIPIEFLIGIPVRATARAEILSARATADFINTVGFTAPILDQEGKVVTPSSVRTVNFEFERPIQDSATGEMRTESVSVQLPLLAMVPIPALRIQQLDVTFDAEITQTLPTTPQASPEAAWPKGEPEVQILGKVTTPTNRIRSTDYASRYHVELHAADSGPSEALSRVIDMMAQAVAPRHPIGEKQSEHSSPNTSPREPK